jgi:hypothetical protein
LTARFFNDAVRLVTLCLGRRIYTGGRRILGLSRMGRGALRTPHSAPAPTLTIPMPLLVAFADYLHHARTRLLPANCGCTIPGHGMHQPRQHAEQGQPHHIVPCQVCCVRGRSCVLAGIFISRYPPPPGMPPPGTRPPPLPSPGTCIAEHFNHSGHGFGLTHLLPLRHTHRLCK